MQSLMRAVALVGALNITIIDVSKPTIINSSTIHDDLFMSDILTTGWAALDFAGQGPGDTDTIFGAGPVEQMTILSAAVRGASRIYVVDHLQGRLDLAAAHGAIPVNFALEGSMEALRRFEPAGVTRVADCVGYEAEDAGGNINSSIVLHQAGQVVAPQGGIGVVGVYGSGNQAQSIDIKPLFMNDFSARGSVSSPLSLGTQMLNLIVTGKLRPGSIVSAVIGIEEAPEYYARFDRREETKVVIEFPFEKQFYVDSHLKGTKSPILIAVGVSEVKGS